MGKTFFIRYGWLALAVLPLFAPFFNPLLEDGAQQTRDKQASGQSPRADEAQTIRVGTQLVNVLFSVTDKRNQYVNDLTKGDVTVLENGKPQQIFTFKRELDLPLTIVVLVDISNSVLPILPRLTGASSRFLDSVMRPHKDMAAIIQFNIEATLIQDLTPEPSRLRDGLREIARTAMPRDVDYRATIPPPNTGMSLGGTSIYDSVVAVCEDLLARKPGRKTIILFTDGYDTTSRLRRPEALDEALRAETVIYAIGIGNDGDDGVDKAGLNKLCEPTGGRAFVPRDGEGLDRAFKQLEQELRQQYLLAYEPANDTPDGSFRKIEVRVHSRKELRVHHRQGYYALKH
jgi:Ca-activated chloride channel homolog